MNAPENTTPDASADASRLAEQVNALQRQNTLLLLGVLVLSIVLTGFLFLQARRAGYDLRAVKAQKAQVAENMRNVENGINFVVSRLVEYGQQDAEFRSSVLSKYPILTSAPPASATAPANRPPTTAPAAGAPAKK